MGKTFKAMIVTEGADGAFTQSIGERRVEELPPGDLLIRVRYSSLNYKDALSATGHKGVTRRYPHTPGIDAAGVVEESTSTRFHAGDEVIVTGHDMGMNTPGGFGQYVRVPAEWAMHQPFGLSLKEAMIYGTAGLTAALSMQKLMVHGVTPEAGEILVTGATGGVGSMAVALLAQAGYRVVALTGKTDAAAYLTGLGASDVLDRQTFLETAGKPLLKERWAGAVDTVGGAILDAALRSMAYGSAVTCCGMVASAELHTNVYPFILRGISLYGVDSVQSPMPVREAVWEKLAGPWKPHMLEGLASECGLEQLPKRIHTLLVGGLKGRTLVNLHTEPHREIPTPLKR